MSHTDKPAKEFLLVTGKKPFSAYEEAIIESAGKELQIIRADIDAFTSGERFCELKINKNDITGAHVHIVMNMEQNSDSFFVDAISTVETLKEYGAKTIHAILPFAPYARQDREFGDRAVSLMGKYFPKHLKAAGVDFVTTFDVHSKAAEGFYVQSFGQENVRFISAAEHIVEAVKKITNDNPDVKVGGPDGGDKPNDVAQIKAHQVGKMLHGEDKAPEDYMFYITKGHTGVNSTVVKDFKGNVEGAVGFEIDDMTDTGGTLVNGARKLKEKGAKQVIAAVTHGFFSGNSLDILTSEMIGDEANPIDYLVVTDSIMGVHDKVEALPEKQRNRVVLVSTVPMIGQALALKIA